MPTTDPWTGGNGNPVVSWHKFCNLQNKTFFCTVPSPSQNFCHSHSSGPQSWKNLDSSTVLFTCLLPTIPLPPPEGHPLHCFLPRLGLSCPYPKPAPGNIQERDSLPVWTAAGEVWGEGQGWNLCCDSCKKEGGPPRSSEFSSSSCLSLLPGPGNRNRDMTKKSSSLRTSGLRARAVGTYSTKFTAGLPFQVPGLILCCPGPWGCGL